MKHILTTLAVSLVLAAVGAAAAPNHGAHGKKDGKAAVVCPVMKNAIASPGKASSKSVFKGKTYYFCCGGCKPQFDKDPYKYLCPVTGDVLPKKPVASSTYKGKTYQFCCAPCKPKFDKDPAKYLAKK